MIVNKDIYNCPNCNEIYIFNTSEPFETVCPTCKCKLVFLDNADCDTENKPSYDPTKDPNSQFYIPTVTCPYCQSTNTKKITIISKAVHTAMFGVFSMGRNAKEWHCNSCKSDF